MAKGNLAAGLMAQARDPKTRFLTLVALMIAIGGIVVSYSVLNQQVGERSSAELSSTPNVESIPGDLGSPYYERVISRYNQEEAQSAYDRGEAFVPVLQGHLQIETDLTLPLPPAPLPQVVKSTPEEPDVPYLPQRTSMERPAPPEPLPVVAKPPPMPDPIPEPLWIQADQALAGSMQSQIGGIIGGWRPQPSQSVIFYVPGNGLQQVAGPNAGQTTDLDNSPQIGPAVAPPGNQQLAPSAQLVKPGQILFARLITRAVTTKPGPVLAEVVGGKLGGCRIIGTLVQRDDVGVLQFNTIVFKDGSSTGINALAVDPADGTTGLATSVDRFFFERFVVATAAAFISSFAESASEPPSNTTVTVGVGGTSTNEQTQKASTEESVYAGLSAAADVVTNEIQARGAKYETPEVTIAQGTLFGLMFTEELVGPDLN